MPVHPPPPMEEAGGGWHSRALETIQQPERETGMRITDDIVPVGDEILAICTIPGVPQRTSLW
jgi:hypothetical protein